MKRCYVAIAMSISLIFGIGSLRAQSDIKHPIDIERENCHNSSATQTTMDMVDCELTAAEKWDQELNKYYKALMSQLNKEQQEHLRQSQRKWIAFRDAEFIFSEKIYSDGSMGGLSDAKTRADFIRSRVLQLKDYLESIQ